MTLETEVDVSKIDTSANAKYQLMPPLSDEERAALKEDILTHGILVPIEFDEEGKIIDGHHRLAIYQELIAEGHQIPMYDTIIRRGLSEDEKQEYVISLNLKRRHLSNEQRRDLFWKLRNHPWNFTLKRIAEVAGSSVATVWRELATFPNEKVEDAPAYVEGADGRFRPTKYATRSILSGGMPVMNPIPMAPANPLHDQRPAYNDALPPEEVDENYIILIECKDETHQAELLERFIADGLQVRALVS